ncbi:uncharacterized protein LOC131694093 isoform X3 [Topomyia yanbarensis]|uniref:uncharacterized protein LOC131694093 isoform X3 n=1 Tax=Topomyia yanbarensis TaxID=2498891 RepID=UPI00273AF573|nr:uncharacterized protein LOC131694093 isoform X3 [Topomyia yanbarensis]
MMLMCFISLTAQKVTDASLVLFDETALMEIGINAKGPRMLILSIIEELKHNEQPHRSDGDAENRNISAPDENLRSILINDIKFRHIVYNKLDKMILPNDAELWWMIRILCASFERLIYDKKGYPTCDEQCRLAKTIIRTFPVLKKSRVNDNAPSESAFFWWHSGNEKGPHSGYIYHRVRNMIKALPKELKKYRRMPECAVADSVSNSILEKATQLSTIMASVENYTEIKQGMDECFPLHQLLLKERKGTKAIIQTLPHITSFKGRMIHDAFYRLNPVVAKDIDFTPILSQGLLLVPNSFREVEDVYLRGLLRIFSSLSRKGINESGNKVWDSIEQLYAAPIIQWTQNLSEYLALAGEVPHLICEAEMFKMGTYSIAMDGVIVMTDSSFRNIVDIFFKAFSVFGTQVPTRLQMLDDLLCILVYKTKIRAHE